MTLCLIATTTMGLESVLAQEIKDLGYTDVKTFDGKVEFTGTLTDICKANMWLRTAGRIYIKVAEFKATTFDMLFDKTKAIAWEQFIDKKDQFPVSKISSRKSILFSKSDGQRIVKKAIVERLKIAHKTEFFPEMKAKVAIRVQIDKDIVTLSIDTTGEGLNKRGYRAYGDEAPLKETLAAGLILLSQWRPHDDVLMDPFCGSGTILTEAGLIAKNIAPGINRDFVSENFKFMPKNCWEEAKIEAKDRINKTAKYRIYGSDMNYRAIKQTNNHNLRAGLPNIHVQKRSLSEISSRFDKGKIITNPPYGERLGEREETEILYRQMGAILSEKFPEWSYYILTANEKFETCFGDKATKNRKLYNGGIKCWYYQYWDGLR